MKRQEISIIRNGIARRLCVSEYDLVPGLCLSRSGTYFARLTKPRIDFGGDPVLALVRYQVWDQKQQHKPANAVRNS